MNGASGRFRRWRDFARHIRPSVSAELAAADAAERAGDLARAYAHLERAHVLGQGSTREHVRVHLRMLKWGLRHRDRREVRGQMLRLVGAATKTAVGLVPTGNTGGSNISPFRRLPVPADLQAIIDAAP
ncbi:DUF3703 domain-containing protein [Sinimarinibacterium flocculans]|uniref:DUF3703 domain-containing protein n=1 Tax=Sinimarinibacterium flocculans TaxID=985250 RepID=UPI003518CEF4